MEYTEFKKFLLPGNYALTKSMEINKVSDSGTLWYTKKFLVWYYFIFLSDEIKTRGYINKIKTIFEKYVNSISEEEVRVEAKNFFFPECNLINCSSYGFRSFEDFKGNKEFDNSSEKIKFEESAKKYYLAFLLGSGGQSGIKKYIKEKIYNPTFNMTQLEEIILAYPDFNPNRLNQIINDYHGFLRNERQILFYYGYFHSKTSGAKDKEFSSLTPVGELGLYANFDEFLCIWEHQKIKMISQPLTVEINNIADEYKNKADEYFGISYSPYLDILRYFKEFDELTLELYKFIISRNKYILSIKNWSENSEIIENLDKITDIVTRFARQRDIDNEDSNKELSKYLLGIIKLPKDKESNNKSFFIKEGNRTKIIEEKKEEFQKVLLEYEKLEKYKEKKYFEIFKNSEKELKEKYKNESYEIGYRERAEWELYLIKIEKIILLGIILLRESNLDVLLDKYQNILKKLGIKSKRKLEKEIENYRATISGEIEIFDEDEEYNEDYNFNNLILREGSNDLIEKIKEISKESGILELERKRNINLISLMKNYYLQNYKTENNMLKCECCGKVTFITSKNEPYLEFHHLIPFGNGNDGPDHYLNIFALCPECHRKMHYLKLDKKNEIYNLLSINNYLNRNIINRLKELKEKKVLKSYQMEYLISENAITKEQYNEIMG
ncbi:HNH endonuclease signature motif containing protein [Fusobacterium ulcerans]|uniref:HNH endonuclease signature motif containing protein n=1 Tax=Fusobacterium ulcerans TaxID=861 RepID=UPI0026DABE4A|nr:HNH endonuclease signature motif containing protein [Fusobacterium ulcerans]